MSENKGEYQAGEQQLKPCPFCGGQYDLEATCDGAKCNYCGAVGPIVDSREDGIATWNTRAANAEVERLRAQLAEYSAGLAGAANEIHGLMLKIEAARAALVVLAVEAYYNDHRDDWRSPDCGLRLEHETTGKDAPTPWQFAADALKELE